MGPFLGHIDGKNCKKIPTAFGGGDCRCSLNLVLLSVGLVVLAEAFGVVGHGVDVAVGIKAVVAQLDNGNGHIGAVVGHTLEVIEEVVEDLDQIQLDGFEPDEDTNAAEAERYTKLSGVTLTDPQIGEMALATELVPDSTDPDAETVPVTVTGAERLRALISVMGHLESNSIIGQISEIDADNLNDLQLWYGDRFQVLLGDTKDLGYKISAMKAAVDQMSQYQSGILDVSFTVDTGDGEPKVIHTPFA